MTGSNAPNHDNSPTYLKSPQILQSENFKKAQNMAKNNDMVQNMTKIPKPSENSENSAEKVQNTTNVHPKAQTMANNDEVEQDKIEECKEFEYLTFWYANAEFLTNKFDKLKARISNSRPQIIAIVESGIQESVDSDYYFPSDALALDGYVMHRQDNEEEIRGGILVYVHESLQTGVVTCKKITNLSSEFNECLLLEIKMPEKNILFGAFYRKGKSTVKNNKCLRELINVASTKYDSLVFCGDFNFPTIDWKGRCVTDKSVAEASRFYDCLMDCNLIQNVLEFTRKRGDDEPSLLDLVITEDTQTQVSPSITVDAPLGKSDHGVIQWRYLVGVTGTQQAESDNEPPRLNYSKGDYKTFRKLCQDVDWNKTLGYDETKNNDIDSMLEKFYSKIHEIESATIPTYTDKKKKNDPPWLKKSTLKVMKKKYHSWKRYQDTQSYHSYQKYIKDRDKASKSLRAAKKAYEEKLAKECKQNPKAFYKYANFKQKKRANHIRLYKDSSVSNTLIANDEENANLLSRFYQSNFTDEQDAPELIFNAGINLLFNEQPPEAFEFNGKISPNKLGSITTSREDICKLLKELDPFKSSSPTCIHPRLLKEAHEELSGPLVAIFNTSLIQGKVPQQWKKGFVTPIYKGDDRHMCKNYRPVTITSVLCRLLERIIKDQIVSHVVENEILSDRQHGFRSGRSCMTNLLQALEYITTMTDLGIPVDEVFLDFAKAFDKVPHQRLLWKLKKCGIDNTLLAWIESFVSSRTQQVRVKKSLSKQAKVLSGVPQGSILGPLLFILYINDLPNSIVSDNNIFADDTKLYTKAGSQKDADSLQRDLDSVSNWCDIWGMKLNADKCHILHLGAKNNLYQYYVNGIALECVDAEKDLGVMISKDLKPDTHIKKCVSKANSMVGMIRRTFTNINKDMFNRLYKVYVRPILEYCQQIWSPHLQKDIDEIEKVQRRATKLVKGLGDLEYEERLDELKLFRLSDRRRRGDMITVYKMINGMTDIDFTTLFKLNTRSNVNMNTRSHQQQISLTHMASMKTDVRRSFFSQRIIVPWNSLPPTVVNSANVEMFKRNYDMLVLNNVSHKSDTI